MVLRSSDGTMHIMSKGVPGPCVARIRPCPRAHPLAHFDATDVKSINDFADEINELRAKGVDYSQIDDVTKLSNAQLIYIQETVDKDKDGLIKNYYDLDLEAEREKAQAKLDEEREAFSDIVGYQLTILTKSRDLAKKTRDDFRKEFRKDRHSEETEKAYNNYKKAQALYFQQYKHTTDSFNNLRKIYNNTNSEAEHISEELAEKAYKQKEAHKMIEIKDDVEVELKDRVDKKNYEDFSKLTDTTSQNNLKRISKSGKTKLVDKAKELPDLVTDIKVKRVTDSHFRAEVTTAKETVHWNYTRSSNEWV